MENRQTEVQLPPEQQKQYQDLMVAIKEKRNDVMQLEDQIADLFNLPRDSTDRMNISKQMHTATNSIIKIEKEIENLEKKRVELTESSKLSPKDTISETNPHNYGK